MRRLNELNIDSSKLDGPNAHEIDDFENWFGVKLPLDYIGFLRFSNGGSPEVDTFVYRVGEDEGEGAVSTFFSLTSDKDDTYGIWYCTGLIESVLGFKCVAIAENGGGDMIFLDMRDKPPSVKILYRSSGNSTPEIADTFEDFIDSLHLNPDYD